MIKVINIISDTNIGGAGKVIINFSRNFDTKNFEIVVVLPKGSALVKELEGAPIKLIEIDGLKDKSLDFKSLFKLRKIIKEEKPDIVHTHASSIARIAARTVKGVKVIYTRHCAYPVSERIKKGIGQFIYKSINEYFSDRIIAVGYAAEENLLEGGISKDKIDTFFNGVEQIATTSEEARKKLKKQYGVADDEFVIGILARLEYVKGHDTFIDAANILLKKGMKAKFFICGAGTEEERLKAKVKELGLEKNIIFTGFVKNVGDFLNIFDVQVNCSFGTETSSLSLLEGMSIGVPAVASNYGGNPYLIFDKENGFIVPIQTPEATAEAIEKILTNADTRKYMQEKSVEIFNNKFTVAHYVKNVQGVYEKVAAQPRKRHVNVLDIFIILAVLIAGVIGFKLMNKQDATTVMSNGTKVVYSVKATSCLPEVEKYIEVGTTAYDSVKNYNIGTIIDAVVEPNQVIAPDLVNGTFVSNERNDMVDVTLKIEANANVSDRVISIGDYELKVGKEAFVRGKGYALSGYVISIER